MSFKAIRHIGKRSAAQRSFWGQSEASLALPTKCVQIICDIAGRVQRTIEPAAKTSSVYI
jgi:hypothetical protein